MQAAKLGFAAALLLALTLDGLNAAPGGRQVRSYDNAIQRQNDQITNVRTQLRKSGCGFAILGRSAAICSELNTTLVRMEKNLAQLQNKRAQLARRNDKQPQPAKIPQVRAQEKPQASSQPMRPRNVSGKLRTLCVRSCDGYYFPVSWSVSQGAFERDGKACEAMCPGTGVELYYHRIAGEEPEDMVSATTGLPYRDSKTAFLYKQPELSTPANCSCGASAQSTNGFQTIGGDYQSNYADTANNPDSRDATVTAAIPRPHERPDPADDPETLATREGGLDAAGLKALATPPPISASDKKPLRQQIRVVGPVFLPAQEAAADLPAPAPAHDR